MQTNKDSSGIRSGLEENFAPAFRELIETLRNRLDARYGLTGASGGNGVVPDKDFLAADFESIRAATDGERLKLDLTSIAGAAREADRHLEIFKIAPVPIRTVEEKPHSESPATTNRKVADDAREIVDRRIIGGGGYTAMAVSDLGFSRAIGGSSKLDRIKRMLDEYMRELVAAEVGTSNRRLGYSPVRQ